jgi:hypothetical protein
MITANRKASFTRRLNMLKRLLRAWATLSHPKDLDWIDEKVHDPKLLTNCSCAICKRDKYRKHRSSLKREAVNELE